MLARRIAVFALCLLGGCVTYDPKNATFHRGTATARSPAPTAISKFEWRTTERDAAAFVDKVARRASGASVTSSRLAGALELSAGATRLRLTPSADDLYFECWADTEMTCRSLLTTVLEAEEPPP